MAYDTLRASGNNQYGVMTDVDRANFGSAQSAQDFVLRKKLQDEALAREEAQRLDAQSAAERMQVNSLNAAREREGTFGEKQAMETARVQALTQPQLEALKQRQTEMDRSWNAGQATRDFEGEVIRQRLGLLKGEPGMQFSDPKIAERARYRTLTGGDLPATFEDDLLKSIITSAAGQAAGTGDYGALGGIFEAAKGKDLTKLPTNIGPQPQALPFESVQKSVEGRAKAFGEQDAATFGFDPEMSDVQGIVKQRDELAKAIKAQNPRVTDQAAIDAANRIIDDQLAPSAKSMGTGWIKTLRQALGILPGDAPAAPSIGPRTGGMMSNFVGP